MAWSTPNGGCGRGQHEKARHIIDEEKYDDKTGKGVFPQETEHLNLLRSLACYVSLSVELICLSSFSSHQNFSLELLHETSPVIWNER